MTTELRDDPDEWGDDEEQGAEWSAESAAHAAAVRTVWLAIGALGLLVVGVIALALGGVVDDDDGGDVPTVADDGAVTDDPVLAPVSIGPAPGVALADHVAVQAAALEAATGRRVAVVSLTSYRDATSADEVAATVGAEVLARLVTLPGSAPELVAGDLQAWVDERRGPLGEERDALAEILPTVEEGSEFIPIYEADLARLDAVLDELGDGGELVFGLVVVADAGTLRLLAQQAEVRLVDVGPDAHFDASGAYAGVRPEELDVAGTPDVRPI